MIQVTCSCGKSYNVPGRFAGKKGKCPACGNPVQVPLNPEFEGADFEASQFARPRKDETAEKNAQGQGGVAGHSETASGHSAANEPASQETQQSHSAASGWKDSLVGSLTNLKDAAREKAGALQKSARAIGSGSRGARGAADNKQVVRNLKWVLIILPVIFVLFLGWLWIKGSQAEKDYKSMMAAVSDQKNLRLVEQQYQNYVSKHPKSRYAEEIRQALQEMPERLEDQEFEDSMKKMDELGEAYEEREKILKKFLSLHPGGKHAKEVQQQLKEIPGKIEERDFNQLKAELDRPIKDLQVAENMVWNYLTTYPKGSFEKNAKALLEELPVRYEQESFKTLNEELEQLGDRYEEMAPLYKGYLGKHMYGAHYEEIQDRLAKIPDLIDDRDFGLILNTEWESLDAKREALEQYLKSFPRGRHVEEARNIIDQYPLEYAREKKRELEDLEEQGRLEDAIALSREFMKSYPEHRDVSYFKNAIVRLERKLIPERAAGDTAAMINAYNSFIHRYPGHAETERAVEERARLVAEFEEQTWSAAVARAESASRNPGEYSRAFDDYLRLFPKGKYVQEARDRIAGVKRDAEAIHAQGEWDQVKARARNAEDPAYALDVLEQYLAKGPESRFKREAQQEIVRIELERFARVAPFAPEEEPQKVFLNDGTSLTGTVRRASSGQITLTSSTGDRYYLGPDKVKDIEITNIGKMMRQFNESLKQLTPQRPDSYAKLAEWCLGNGFRKKGLLVSVMAAYLNPADSEVTQRLKDSKFSFSNGRWRSSDKLWR